MSRIAIIGSGAWGTALAISLTQQRGSHSIALWSHTAAVAEAIAQHRENHTYLPGHVVPGAVTPTADIAQALALAEIVIGVMPSAHVHAIYTRMAPHLTANQVIVSATKGIIASGTGPLTYQRISEVIGDVLAACAAFITLRRAERAIVCAGSCSRPPHCDDHRVQGRETGCALAG